MDWHSFRVYYYDDNKDGLVLDGVRPLFRQLAGLPTFHTRHWLRGPHLRLNICCDKETLDRVVEPEVRAIIGGHLRDRPSTQQLDPERHLEMHQRLATLEQEPGPLLPWLPDNSISQVPFDRREQVLGSTEAADLLIDFQVGTTDLAFTMTDAIAGGVPRLQIAFDLMIATAHALSGVGIKRGFISFRAHSEGFLAGSPDELRSAWAKHFDRHRDALRARTAAVVESIDAGVASGFVREWLVHVEPFRQRGAELLAAGRIPMQSPAAGSDQPAESFWKTSPLHRKLLASPIWDELTSADWFRIYRLMLNYTYLHMTRLGVTPVERFMLGHLAASAVEDCFGLSAFELISQPLPIGGTV